MRFDVLASRDGGLFWRRFPEVEADGPSEAVRRLVRDYPTYGHPLALFDVLQRGERLLLDADGEVAE